MIIIIIIIFFPVKNDLLTQLDLVKSSCCIDNIRI